MLIEILNNSDNSNARLKQSLTKQLNFREFPPLFIQIFQYEFIME